MDSILFKETIPLLKPDLSGGINLMKAFNERKSDRDFKKGEKITLKQLSEKSTKIESNLRNKLLEKTNLEHKVDYLNKLLGKNEN